ncbi:MAG: hypothetical protein K2G47_12035 [Muribaculum sp.]|nr:hypothetical protein [Muribaculum sp.]
MKRISIILVSMVYILPGVLAVLAHTHAIDKVAKTEQTEVIETGYAAVDTVPATAPNSPYLVMLEVPLKK